MVEMPTQSRGGVKGGTSSLFVCPLWGLGQRPNRSTGDQFKGKSQQRCRQRSVPASNFALPQKRPPKLLYSPLAHWRDHAAGLVDMACLFCKQRISPLRRRQGGFAVAPLTPSQCTPMFLDFDCCRGIRACGRDKGAATALPLP